MEAGFLTVPTIVREAGSEAAGLEVISGIVKSVCYELGDSACHDSRTVTVDTIFQSNHLAHCESLKVHCLGVADQNEAFRSGCRCLSFNRTSNQKILLKDFFQSFNRSLILIQENAQSNGRLICSLMFYCYGSLAMNLKGSLVRKSDDCADAQEINIHLFSKIYSFKNRLSISTCILALVKSSGYYKFVSPSLLMSS